MARYIVRRLFYMLPVTLVLSFVCFLVVDLAPGDFVSVYESSIRSNLNMSEQQKKVALSSLGELRASTGSTVRSWRAMPSGYSTSSPAATSATRSRWLGRCIR